MSVALRVCSNFLLFSSKALQDYFLPVGLPLIKLFWKKITGLKKYRCQQFYLPAAGPKCYLTHRTLDSSLDFVFLSWRLFPYLSVSFRKRNTQLILKETKSWLTSEKNKKWSWRQVYDKNSWNEGPETHCFRILNPFAHGFWLLAEGDLILVIETGNSKEEDMRLRSLKFQEMASIQCATAMMWSVSFAVRRNTCKRMNKIEVRRGRKQEDREAKRQKEKIHQGMFVPEKEKFPQGRSATFLFKVQMANTWLCGPHSLCGSSSTLRGSSHRQSTPDRCGCVPMHFYLQEWQSTGCRPLTEHL